MGFFQRLGNLWKGFLSLFISGLETQNPEIVYDAAINAQVEQYQKLMKAVSGIVYLRNKLQKEYEEKKTKLGQIHRQIPAAVESGEDETAMILIEQKNSLTADLTHLEEELEKTKQDAEEAKANLISFQGEIEKLKVEKEKMLAKRENAKARLQIQQQLSGISTEAHIRALEGVREDIEKLHAQVDVSTEIHGQSLGKKMQDIEKKASSVAARSELEEIKKQLQEQRSSNTEKTL